MDRRTFLAAGAGLAFAPSLTRAADEAPAGKRLRVAVIGHTGRGNYGHGLDTCWLKVPETEIVAVADADAAGLAAELKKLKVTNGFADYRAMLESTKPDLVAVCPRQVDEHCEMIVTAIEAGARGIYIEKPFCRELIEADGIAAACKQYGAKIAVAHRNRYHPTLAVIDKLIADGGIGRVLEIRGRGKSDRRGGAEDLWVLGSHVLNLVHYFGGDPVTCSAALRQNGKPVTKADVKDGAEGLGPLAGNEVRARFETERGLIAYFDSLADDGTAGAGFGLRIVGSTGVIDIKCDAQPLAHLQRGNPFKPAAKSEPWLPITTGGVGVEEPRKDLNDFVGGYVGPVLDLIAAVKSDRQPLCGLHDAVTTVEMISAVFESHRRGGAAVKLPLETRQNPLGLL